MDNDNSFLNFANYLNGHFKIGKHSFLNAEVPFAFSDNSFGSDFTLGNIGLGIGYKNIEFNIHAPLSSRNTSSLLGIAHSLPEGVGTFFQESVSIKVNANIHLLSPPESGSGFNIKIRPGATLQFPTETFLLDLGIRVGYQTKRFNTHMALSSTLYVTGDKINLSEKLYANLSGYFGYKFDQVELGFLFRVPFGSKLRDFTKASAGLSIKLNLFRTRSKNKIKDLGFVF